MTWVVCSAACASKATYFSVTPKDFGSPKAKATAYFGVYKEEVPAELPHDVVIDEALLTSALHELDSLIGMQNIKKDKGSIV